MRVPASLLAILSAAAAAVSASAAHAEPPRVLATVKPLHAIVAGVMQGVGAPELLIDGAASAHVYALRPSDARSLQGADIVFWLGEGMETFLAKPLRARERGGRAVAVVEEADLVLHPRRDGRDWRGHGHGHEHAGHHDDADGKTGEARHRGHPDMHVWLDPENARRIAALAADVLGRADPPNVARYTANAERVRARLSDLDAELRATLAPVRDLPFVVFHDAWQYFEKRYGLTAVGSIAVSPELPPGARRIAGIRERIADSGARCVFSEPQFEPALVGTVTEGSGARTGELDPYGAGLRPGPELYAELMRGIARSLVACLAASPATR